MVSKSRSLLVTKNISNKIWCPICGYEGWLSRRSDGYYRVIHGKEWHLRHSPLKRIETGLDLNSHRGKSCYIGSLKETARILVCLGYPELLENLDPRTWEFKKSDKALLARLVTQTRQIWKEIELRHHIRAKERRWRGYGTCPHCKKRVRVWFQYTGYCPMTKYDSQSDSDLQVPLYPLTTKVNSREQWLSYVHIQTISDRCPHCRKPVLMVIPSVGSCDAWLDTARSY